MVPRGSPSAPYSDRVWTLSARGLQSILTVCIGLQRPSSIPGQLARTDLRAYVMSESGLTLKNFYPRLCPKLCFLIFSIEGSERKGLVSVKDKKKKGQYDMKLLAVDIPMASRPDQKLFLVGDEEEYRLVEV